MNAPRQQRRRRERGRPDPPAAGARGATFDRLFPLAYASLYALIALVIQLSLFRIGDIGVESDFYAEIGPAAQALARGELNLADFPYKGPVTPVAVALMHAVAGPLGADWYRSAVLLNTLCAAAFLVLLYRLLRARWPRGTTAAAMVGSSLVFEFFFHAHKASSDLLFLLLFYASAGLLLGPAPRRWRLLAAGALGGLAYLTRYNGLVLLPSSLVALLVLGGGARRALARWGLYAGGFLVVALPWLAIGLAQTGSVQGARNLENTIVQERLADARTAGAPADRQASLPSLILREPLWFARAWLSNLPGHLRHDATGLLNWATAALFGLGLLRLPLVRPQRRQTALLCFPLLYFLAMGVVGFTLPRFSLPLLPAYLVLGWSVVFGSGPGERQGGPRRQDRFTLLPPGTGLRWALPRTLVAAAILASVLIMQARTTRTGVAWYEARQPDFVLPLASALKRLAPAGERAVLMARKPHAAFYAGLRHRAYPVELTTAPALLEFARAEGVDLILFSGIEQGHYPQAPWLATLDTQPGVSRVWADEYGIVFALSPAGP